MTADPPNRDVELGTREGSELANAKIDDLSTPTDGPSDKSIAEQIGDQDVRALRAAHSYRRALVKWSLRTVGYLAVASTLFMAGYIWLERGHIEASVMISFFVSVVAETVGVLYVIARYLFPPSGLTSRTAIPSSGTQN